MGEEKLVVLLRESLATAARTGAAKPADFTRVIVDTTAQPKAIAFPTDARLLHRARERLVRLAQKHGVTLRQSYVRVGKAALIRAQRYAHARQFRRAWRVLKSLRTQLGRVIRDVDRKIGNDAALAEIFALPLHLACRMRAQQQRQRGPKVYSLHAPEVECIGKGKAHRPYEFGVKVSVATPLHQHAQLRPLGQLRSHCRYLQGGLEPPHGRHGPHRLNHPQRLGNGQNLGRLVSGASCRDAGFQMCSSLLRMTKPVSCSAAADRDRRTW